MSARVYVAAGAGVVLAVVGGVLVWRARGTGAEGDDVKKPEQKPAPLVSQSVDVEVIGYVNGQPSRIVLRTISNGKRLRADAADKFNAMSQAAAAAGMQLAVNSGFRSQEEQKALHDGYMQKLPGYNLAAAPGWSNHQGGISVDVSTDNLGRSSPQYKWLAVNARRFGFINDVGSEAWHWTYKPTAALLLA